MTASAGRLMKNVRSGKIAAYDESLVAGGRWVEVLPEPEKKGIALKKLKVSGSLNVKAKDDDAARDH